MHIGLHQSFGGYPAGLLGRRGQPSRAQEFDRFLEITAGLLHGGATVHDSRTGPGPEFFDQLRLAVHCGLSVHVFTSWHLPQQVLGLRRAPRSATHPAARPPPPAAPRPRTRRPPRLPRPPPLGPLPPPPSPDALPALPSSRWQPGSSLSCRRRS